jgi:Acetoacetate decarboxylase (ADC)
VTIKGAWEGPAALQLFQHALAPVAGLPVLEVISGVQLQSDLTLGLGTSCTTTLPSEAEAREIAMERTAVAVPASWRSKRTCPTIPVSHWHHRLAADAAGSIHIPAR